MFQNPYMNQFPNPYQNPYQFPRQNQFITKQVSNIEEAKACLVDPLSIYLFVDMNSGKIYMKQMNNNGLSDFYIFSAEVPMEENKTDPFQAINERLINIENMLGGKSNVQSVPNNSANAESKPAYSEPAPETESTVIQQNSRNDKWENRNGTQANGNKHR